jgi:hypothetical protein
MSQKVDKKAFFALIGMFFYVWFATLHFDFHSMQRQPKKHINIPELNMAYGVSPLPVKDQSRVPQFPQQEIDEVFLAFIK